MCGRFGLTRPERLKLERFGLSLAQLPAPRYNIAPGAEVLVLRERKGTREAGWLRWGLVPWWAQNPAIGARMANARVESAGQKPAFRDAMKARRCLIPADVFFEWQGKAGQKGRQPFAVTMADREPFALGGLWDYWRPKDRSEHEGEGFASCTILTTAPNTLLSTIHERMPVIIEAGRYADWLDPRTPSPLLEEMWQPYPSELMQTWAVSPLVNRTEVDDARVLAPATPPADEVLELF